MFAILGEIPFQVLGSPERLSSSRRYDYVEHRVIEDRPRLQWLADSLESLVLEMMFHRAFTDPIAQLALLFAVAETHQALPLVFGNGDFRGYFVIAEVGTTSRQLSAAGDPLAIMVRVVLREWPLTFDPAAPPVPSFTPIGVVASAATSSLPAGAGTMGQPRSAAFPSAGVSPLLHLPLPSGPASPVLQPADVPTAVIVRSA